jgi:hypothetical protein
MSPIDAPRLTVELPLMATLDHIMAKADSMSTADCSQAEAGCRRAGSDEKGQ